MRGSKAKRLRKEARLILQQGHQMGVHKPVAGQILTNPVRYLYQALKGRNHVQLQITGG